MEKLGFGYQGDPSITLKSWVPKLRRVVQRLIALESATYVDDYRLGEEILTNKLHSNGKPIYRYGFHVSALPNATSTTIAHGVLFEDCVDIYGRNCTNGTVTIPFPYPFPGSNDDGIYENGSGQVFIQTSTNRSAYSADIYLEYTKSDD